MAEIKKMIFTVSEKNNPMVYLWVDEDDTNKMSDATIIALKSQVAYLFFQSIGANIEIKQSKTYKNVTVPDMFTNLFENYKIATDPTVKAIGAMLNASFNNFFDSISFWKNGAIVTISQEECDAKCEEYMEGYTNLYNTALKVLGKSKIKALKNIAKVIDSETSKPAEIKEANSIISSYALMLNREVINKNNYVIEKSDSVCPF